MQIKVPATFALDHLDRCRGQAGEITLVARKGHSAILEVDAESLDNLRSDARYYADPFGPDMLPPGLRASAKRTLAAIDKLGA